MSERAEFISQHADPEKAEATTSTEPLPRRGIPPPPPGAPPLDGFANTMTNIGHELLSDLKSPRWIHSTLLLVWCAALLVTTMTLVLSYTLWPWWRIGPTGRTSVTTVGAVCHPDGDFEVTFDTLYADAWRVQNFVQITFGWGELSFSAAKIIDVAWDLVVGRGGQMFLAFFTWKAFAAYIRMLVETEPITYRMFRTAFIEDGPTIWSLGAFIRDVVTRRVRLSKRVTAFMVFAMTFVLLFSTLVSALSGYASVSTAMVEDRAGNFLPFSKYAIVAYIIHDGPRVGLPENFPVPMPLFGEQFFVAKHGTLEANIDQSRTMYESVDNYAVYFGISGANATDSTFRGQALPSPALNITRVQSRIYGQIAARLYVLANETYDLEYVNDKGVCQAGSTYLWGFSLIQLLIVLGLLMVWTAGTITMWLKATHALDSINVPASPGVYTAMLTMTETLRQDCEIMNTNAKALPEKQIQAMIRQDLAGGRLFVSADVKMRMASFRKWARRRMWWIPVFVVVHVAFGFTIAVPYNDLPVFMLAPVGIVWLGTMMGYIIGRRTTTKLIAAAVVMLACFLNWGLFIVLPFETIRKAGMRKYFYY